MPPPSATETIHNPSNPSHFMRLKPMRRRVRVLYGETPLLETDAAIWLLEIGRDVYDPVIYAPISAATAALAPSAAPATRCPLKGEATYFDLVDDAGALQCEKIAWTYAAPFDFAADLAGLMAFYPDHVAIESRPL